MNNCHLNYVISLVFYASSSILFPFLVYRRPVFVRAYKFRYYFILSIRFRRTISFQCSILKLYKLCLDGRWTNLMGMQKPSLQIILYFIIISAISDNFFITAVGLSSLQIINSLIALFFLSKMSLLRLQKEWFALSHP
jgi:hypothetical protein